ncbi:MAG: hypothetical protein ACYDCH_06200 [Gaiellaceae bacterium]
MRLFRREEPLHERLAREGGLVERVDRVEPLDPRPPWQETGVHGVHRPREWDATVTADAPELEGDGATFVALPDGSLLVEDGPDGSLEPLAAAVERELKPPYRARAVRQGQTLWAVQASRLEVLELPDAPAGDSLDVTRNSDGTELRVDGVRTFGSVAALEARGAREGRDYTVHAERLDGDHWEVRAAAL